MCCGGGRDPGGTEARLRRGLGGPWALGSRHQQHTALCWVLTDPGPSATLQLSVQRPALRSHCPFYRIPWMGWQGSPSAVLSGRVGTHWVSWGMRGPPPCCLLHRAGLSCVFPCFSPPPDGGSLQVRAVPAPREPPGGRRYLQELGNCLWRLSWVRVGEDVSARLSASVVL